MDKYIVTKKEEENILALLLSIEDIGGCGTKKEVLDNIEGKKYLNFTQEDLDLIPIGESSEEPKWRNELAWIRYKLVLKECISNIKYNEWRITPKGISYLHEKIGEIIKLKQSKFIRLTNAFKDRCNEKSYNFTIKL
ncbi:MAG: winged helix-turn-helix domain-containing protein [Candidatus Methanoperedens sp.]